MSNIIPAKIVPVQLTPHRDPTELVREMVQREIEKLMADRDTAVFEPFFRPKDIADGMRRLQTMPQLRKWQHYFREYGCIRCGDKSKLHLGLGFCETCYKETYSRLRSVMRKYKTQHEDCFDRDFSDSERSAKLALGSELNVLPPMRRRR